MTTSKVNAKPVAAANLNTFSRDVVQQRTSSSKRTNTTMDFDHSTNNNAVVLQASKHHHSTTKTNKQKDKCENLNHLSSKPEIINEEIHASPTSNDSIRLTSSAKVKRQSRQDTGDCIRNDEINEDSVLMHSNTRKTKTADDPIQSPTTPSNNSAIPLQQQAMGDHYQTSAKQYKSRSKSHGLQSRRYHRLIDQQDLETSIDEKNILRWRIFMYIIIILILIFVVYRLLLALWPRRKKTLTEKLIDDLSDFFTL